MLLCQTAATNKTKQNSSICACLLFWLFCWPWSSRIWLWNRIHSCLPCALACCRAQRMWPNRGFPTERQPFSLPVGTSRKDLREVSNKSPQHISDFPLSHLTSACYLTVAELTTSHCLALRPPGWTWTHWGKWGEEDELETNNLNSGVLQI